MRAVRIIRMLAILPFFISVAASCKFPELPAIEEVDHSVGGEVEGLWTGADLVLRLEPVGLPAQQLTVSREGAFTFLERVPPDTSFTFEIDGDADQHECEVETPAGEVDAIDITTLRVHW